MFRRIQRFVIVSTVLAAAGTAGATTTRDPSVDPSLAACVRVVAQETAARRIDVVRRTDRFGLGNAEYWLNADVEPASKAYCRTRRNAVSLVESSDGHWRRTTTRRPAAEG